MEIIYRLLNIEDSDILLDFCRRANNTDRQTDRLQYCIKHPSKYFAIAAEFLDGVLNGISIGMTYSYWMRDEYERIPSWIILNTHRLSSPVGILKFNDRFSILLSNHFEKLGYYHFYITRKLPKRAVTNTEFIKIISRGWVLDPYVPAVECIIKTVADFNCAPKLFRSMLPEGIEVNTNPQIAISAFLPNHLRGVNRHGTIPEKFVISV